MTIELSLKRFSQVAGIFAILVGSIVLTGWFIESPALKAIRPDWAPMKANTALFFILAGLSLWFLQSEAASTKKLRLGLSIVKKIVEAHGGRIDFSIKADAGTTFHITLPIQRSSTPAASPARAPEAGKSR